MHILPFKIEFWFSIGAGSAGFGLTNRQRRRVWAFHAWPFFRASFKRKKKPLHAGPFIPFLPAPREPGN